MNHGKQRNYGESIRDGFQYLLANYPEVFAIGQGLWSPWYVGNSMGELEKEFGVARIIDTPVSESAVTGAAVGAALGGYRPIVIHPRLDFMVLAMDPIVNQAAKWAHMLGGSQRVPLTVRGIINRGGQQGAQHSQALHSWYAHIPGLRVVMPATPADARDLLIASVLCDDPVIYIDDRWLYELSDELPPITPRKLREQGPIVRRPGTDATLVAAGYSVQLCLEAAQLLDDQGLSVSVIDLRVINPLDLSGVAETIERTGRLCAVDGGWKNCGLAGEVIARVIEQIDLGCLHTNPIRVTLTDAPAPTSGPLEEQYYTSVEDVVSAVRTLVKRS